MSASDIIAAFGGYAELAGRLNLTRGAVHAWLTNGIPPQRWGQIAALAKAQNVHVPHIDTNGQRRPGITLELLMASTPIPAPAGPRKLGTRSTPVN